MSKPVDLYVLYRFIKAIATPFNETDAFKQGIVDEKGKLLKKPNTTTTQTALTYLSFTMILIVSSMSSVCSKVMLNQVNSKNDSF